MPRQDDARPAPTIRAAPRAPGYADAPDQHGRFGDFGGRLLPEAYIPLLAEVDLWAGRIARDERFWATLLERVRELAPRPTPLTPLRRLARNGAHLWLKREDVAPAGGMVHTHALGFVHLARAMGKSQVLSSGDAAPHALALASAAACEGLSCSLVMTQGSPSPSHVGQCERMGATLIRTDEPAHDHAMRLWLREHATTLIVPEASLAPHPYPVLARELLAHVGRECKAQSLRTLGKMPDAIVAPASMCEGLLIAFADVRTVALHLAVTGGALTPLPTVLRGAQTLTTAQRALGPEAASWVRAGRAMLCSALPEQIERASTDLARLEGLCLSETSALAVACGASIASTLPREQGVLVLASC